MNLRLLRLLRVNNFFIIIIIKKRLAFKMSLIRVYNKTNSSQSFLKRKNIKNNQRQQQQQQQSIPIFSEDGFYTKRKIVIEHKNNNKSDFKTLKTTNSLIKAEIIPKEQLALFLPLTKADVLTETKKLFAKNTKTNTLLTAKERLLFTQKKMLKRRGCGCNSL